MVGRDRNGDAGQPRGHQCLRLRLVEVDQVGIDATRQLPEEGGPKIYQVRNRTLLEQMAPQALARLDAKWDEIVGDWRPQSV